MKGTLKYFLLILFFFISIDIKAQTKKPLDHSVYANWKELQSQQISNDGKWISYEINPQRGSGYLYIMESDGLKKDSIFRGKGAVISPNSSYLAFRLTPHFDSIRNMKIAKKKAEELPKDTLAIYLLSNQRMLIFPNLKSFRLPEKNSDWIVIQFEKDISSKTDKNERKKSDTTESKKDSSKIKKEGTDLLILNPITTKEYRFKNVADYSLSKNGSLVCFTCQVKDSLDSCSVYIFDMQKEKSDRIFNRNGFVKVPSIDETGEQIAFLYSSDTSGVKIFNLFYWNKKASQTICIVDTTNSVMPKGYSVSENYSLRFSENGQKLFYSTAPKPMEEPKDTLLTEEKAVFDLWSWFDPILQPQQLKEVNAEKKRSFLAVYFINRKQSVQLADNTMEDIQISEKANNDIVLGNSDKLYQKLASWDQIYNDYYSVDLKSGKRKLLIEKQGALPHLSMTGNYFLWYSQKDSSWNALNIEKNTKINLTNKLPTIFYSKIHDTPDDPHPVGLVGFTKDDKEVLLYDNNDIWVADLSGNNPAYCATTEYGKKSKIKFTYVKLDREEEYIDLNKETMLKGFNETTKQEGFWYCTLKKRTEPRLIVEDNFKFSNPLKAKNTNKIIWTKGNFSNYPDLYVSSLDFLNAKRISFTNPQQKEYLWGSVELVKWQASNGEEMNGLLYKPENFDKSKKYPMIIYFYERNSDQLNSHYIPRPSYSSISTIFFVSNEYIVFIPDISYKIGYPGQSAYESVVSGALAMVEKGFVDKNRIGIQGQSWGGYQVAYLITQTNMFAAAGAGAPVSNMISAYGGIRWESGMSRMFQYEKSQSRIGGTLWEKPLLFIENSPLFFANKIETPLLMTHNDNDGAVPWYQGIELFTALRRLNKPVWMINYNGDSHNLKPESWGNRVDLSIRLSQFFDHYLKSKPAPKWMQEGIPATKKGKESGY